MPTHQFNRNLRIFILLTPLLTILPSFTSYIYSNSSFILVLPLIMLVYLCHQYHFDHIQWVKNLVLSPIRIHLLQQARKFIVCLIVSYLLTLLICQIDYIVTKVYLLDYAEELMLFFRVVVTFSNMEANLELTDKKHRKHSINKEGQENKKKFGSKTRDQETIKLI